MKFFVHCHWIRVLFTPSELIAGPENIFQFSQSYCLPPHGELRHLLSMSICAYRFLPLLIMRLLQRSSIRLLRCLFVCDSRWFLNKNIVVVSLPKYSWKIQIINAMTESRWHEDITPGWRYSCKPYCGSNGF